MADTPADAPTHEHSAADYYGRCTGCGVRLESPSQWMRDEAERTGGTIVSMTKTVRLPDELTPDQFVSHLEANIRTARDALSKRVWNSILGKSDV